MGPGSCWTARRTYPLLGETLPERQVSDLLAGIKLMRKQPMTDSIAVYGEGHTAPLAIYAALLDPKGFRDHHQDLPQVTKTRRHPSFLASCGSAICRTTWPWLIRVRLPLWERFPKPIPGTVDVYKKLGQADRIRVIKNIKIGQAQNQNRTRYQLSPAVRFTPPKWGLTT